MSERPGQDASRGVWPGAAIAAGSLAASLLVVSLLGSRLAPDEAAGALLLKLGAMWPAAAYLGAAFGLAWPLSRWWRGASDPLAIQCAVGLALMVSLSQILGIAGLLSAGPAIALCAVGVGLTLVQGGLSLRRGWQFGGLPRAWALGAPAAAVLLVAAAMPPGWLWASEYGAYDALSYHLQLPQEWLTAGRVRPLGHNVYSFLPGYIESAFAHLGAMTLAPAEEGLLAGSGWRLIACQGLHAGLTLIAAWLTGRLCARLAANAEVPERVARWSGAVAGCVALATPWAVVTGSLAYNEAGVNAMLAGALLACAQPRLAPGVRGGLVGLLVGVACGFKMTSLFFAGLPAGIALIASVYWRVAPTESRSDGRANEPVTGRLVRAIGAGAAVGLIALWPWLFRNFLSGGNPLFPFATDLFGLAHWTPEQLGRWRDAHAFDGSLLDRLRTLVWSSPASAPDAPPVERFRGFANPQWGLLLPMAALAASFVLARWRSIRVAAAPLSLGFASQLVAWLALTHLQSRFLLPTLPVAAVLIGLALARVRTLAEHRPDGRAAAGLLAGALVLAQTAFLFAIYAGEKQGAPGEALAAFPAIFTGADASDPAATPVGWSHQRGRAAPLLYLVGEATPLYYGKGLVYHTTYDTSPLGELMRAAPDDPAAWAAGLRDRGIGWLMVSPSELARLQRSGWYDPLVTPDAVRHFAETQGGAARVWPEHGRYLVQLAAEPAGPAP